MSTRDKRQISQRFFTATIPNVSYRLDSNATDPDEVMASSLQEALLREVQRMAPPVLHLPIHFKGFGNSILGPDGERAVPYLPTSPADPKK